MGEKDLSEAEKWASSDGRFGFAISVPKFELWLLLHFEERWPNSSRQCDEIVKKHLPYYNKSIYAGDLDLDKVRTAIRFAEARCHHYGNDWSKMSSWTNVHLLVINMLKAANM